jgi:tRNA(Glu) U13 pseudouridine synthase TruD
MQLILKQNPEDFYVEEILDKEFLKPSDKNIFLYKIEKQNLSHKELEYILKQKFPKTVFHFSGMKDKKCTYNTICNHK